MQLGELLSSHYRPPAVCCVRACVRACGLAGYNSTLAVVQGSLAALGVSYLDLLLIHWPGVVNHPLPDPTRAVSQNG
jgi:hypothetical protein